MSQLVSILKPLYLWIINCEETSDLLTWSGYPHLIAELRGERGADPRSGAGVERRGVVVLLARHVRAVRAQQVRVAV